MSNPDGAFYYLVEQPKRHIILMVYTTKETVHEITT